MDSLIRWAGGKRLLVEEYKRQDLFSKESFYVEPFLGGGGSFLGLKQKKSAGCDVNESLIYLWRMVRDEPEELVSRYDYYHGVHTPNTYYVARESYNNLIRSHDSTRFSKETKKDIAGIFFYLMNTCHRGICRYNEKKEFNVPVGDGGTRLPTVEAIREKVLMVSQKIQDCYFEVFDFEQAIKYYGDEHQNVFFYCDPPYSQKEGKGFQSYSPTDWKNSDADRLAEVLKTSGCDFAVSEIDIPAVRERYAGCKFIEIQADRKVGGDRSKVGELLILSRV
jgi:DNA adenine methylase